MKNTSTRECRYIRHDISRQDKLDAIRRGIIEVHLRRCDACRDAAARLSQFESVQIKTPSITPERANQIYDRLIPAVHEITQELQNPKVVWWKKPTTQLGLAGTVAAAAAIALIVFAFGPSKSEQIEETSQIVSAEVQKQFVETKRSGFIDKLEGEILINQQKLDSTKGPFVVKKSTELKVKKGSRFSFRIDDTIRVALVDDCDWKILSSTDTLVEIALNKGRLAVEFDGTSGQMLNIHTPNSIVRVRGTLFTVEVIDENTTKVGVIEGRVDVVSNTQSKDQPANVELGAGQLVVMIGKINPKAGLLQIISDEQRALANEIDSLENSLVATTGRLVHFAGAPERTKVEVEGQLLGYTPLTVRLPQGPISYRLTSPGMLPQESKLKEKQLFEKIAFNLNPSEDYQPEVTNKEEKSPKNVIKRNKNNPFKKKSGKKTWGLIERARAAMTAGDIPFAIGLLEKANLNKMPKKQKVTAMALLAECYSSTGRFAEAANTFDKVATLVPGTKIAQNCHYEVGRLAMGRLGDFGRARASFTAYVASPLDGTLKEEAYFSLCELDSREGAYKQSLHCFNNFLRTFPGNRLEANARLWRGTLTQDVSHKWAAAEPDLLAFIKAKPRHPKIEEARYRIALGRYHAGDKKGSLAMVDKYLKKHPKGKFGVRMMRLKRAIIDPNVTIKAK